MNLGRGGVEVQRGARSSAGAQIEAASFPVWVSVNLIVSNRCATYIPLSSYNMPMSARGIFGRKTKRGGTRWVSLLLGVGIVLVTGTVLADVVLTYTLNNSVGSSNTSPFEWEEGTNYAAASSLSIVSNTCNPSNMGATNPTNCFALSMTVNGVSYVPTTVADAVHFQWLATSATVATSVGTGVLSVVTTANTLPAGSCAWAFISNGALTATSFTYTAGTPCSVSAAAPASVYTACGASTAATASVNLLTGAVNGAVTCSIAKATAAGSALDISYFVYVPGGAVAPQGVASLYLSPVLS